MRTQPASLQPLPRPSCPRRALVRHTLPALRLAALLVVATGLCAPATAEAQAGGLGLRAGVSADPDQFFVGLHYETSPLFDRLRFRPGVEVGFGDDLTLIQLNAEFAYWLPVKSSQWGVYVGGGPAMNIYSFDDNGRGNGDDDVEPGMNFMVGVAHRNGFFGELKVGVIDSPDVKFAVGYSFR